MLAAENLPTVIAAKGQPLIQSTAKVAVHGRRIFTASGLFTYLPKNRYGTRSELAIPSMSNPFQVWQGAIVLDEQNSIRESSKMFAKASQSFFEFGSIKPAVGRACFEYSTLMDSFYRIQVARQLRFELRYDESLKEFGNASQILRATVHFGFLSAYVSACATLETAEELHDKNEAFAAFRNAIALFEQSKFALGLRDELHPTIRIIDSMIKYSISRALFVESGIIADEHKAEESRKKIEQSELIKKEYHSLAGNGSSRINYFPIQDWKRAQSGALIVSYPENKLMWLMNIGSNPVKVDAVGASQMSDVVNPFQALAVPTEKLGRGRIRVVYRDSTTNKIYDEGCLMMV